MEKPALGIPIIIITIFLFMTGYVYFIVGATKPEAPLEPPVTGIQTPETGAPVREPVVNDSSGLSQSAVPAGNEIKSWTGQFVGCVGDNLMVIYVGDEAKTFHTAPGFDGAGLAKGDIVSFDFFHDKNGQPVITSIGKLTTSEHTPDPSEMQY